MSKELTASRHPKAHRANTYPFVHGGIISALLNLCASVPLIQRFEAQHGTLASFALFFGRTSGGTLTAKVTRACLRTDSNNIAALSTFPAFIYVLLDKLVFHTNGALMGAR